MLTKTAFTASSLNSALSKPRFEEAVRRVLAAALASGVFLVAVPAAFLAAFFAGDFFVVAMNLSSL
jgi:hypothetical protein